MERPDIIFIRSYISAKEEFGEYAKVGNVEISNGLCWLAAVTREAGYKTEIIDAAAVGINNTKLADIITRKKPKYIGFSSMTPVIMQTMDSVKKIKALNPDITVIFGGPHITAVPEETMEKFPEIDIGVIGEGETTIVDLLNTLEKKDKKPLSEVNGIIYRDNKELKRTKPREFIKDLDSLPLPAWDLLPNLKKYYFPPAWSLHQKTSALIITSRGCPSQCTFCDRKVFGNVFRFQSAEYVMRMIRRLYYKYGIKHFRINEDNFVLFKKRLDEICNSIIKEKLKISWSCFARVDSINPEMLKLMKKAGCYQISYGIESGSQKILDVEKKNVTLEKIERAVKLTRKAKIKTIGFNMIGHPLETVETMQATIDFNKKIKVDDFKTEFLVPFPGTELYSTGEKYGHLDKDWTKMKPSLDEPTFIPYGVTKEQIIYYNKKGVWYFYLQPRIIFSYLTRLRSFTDIKTLFYGAVMVISMAFKKKQKRACPAVK